MICPVFSPLPPPGRAVSARGAPLPFARRRSSRTQARRKPSERLYQSVLGLVLI